MAGIAKYLTVGARVAQVSLLLAALAPLSLQAQVSIDPVVDDLEKAPVIIPDGLSERKYRRLETIKGKVFKPGKSGLPLQDGRARMLKSKCMAKVNKKTPARHIYQEGSLLFGQGKHPGVFMVYVKTAAYYRGKTPRQWSACGYNSINNMIYLRVHRKLIVNRPA